MKYLVLSDIHGNLEALQASIAAATGAYDSVLVLGDLVGYGADPNAVIDTVRGLNLTAIIRGNHDKVASGVEDADGFNSVARSAVTWTFETLTPENRTYLEELPTGPQLVGDLLEICHGSPFDEDAYVFDELDALRALRASSRPVCLFGHTHVPIVFQLMRDDSLDVVVPGPQPELVVKLETDFKYLVNPGSVGQPRDGDPRASYAIADTGQREIRLYRVDYAIEAAQQKVIRAGLPEILAHRLSLGR